MTHFKVTGSGLTPCLIKNLDSVQIMNGAPVYILITVAKMIVQQKYKPPKVCLEHHKLFLK